MDIQQIKQTLHEASDLYYNKGESMLSDKEYDELYDKLVAYEELHGQNKDSPSLIVGSGIKSGPFPKVLHEYPYMSLKKTKVVTELSTWLDSKSMPKTVKGVLSWKYDGISLMLYYKNGKLFKAATRGDGYIGEDVTKNCYHIKDIPNEISDKRDIVVRGEAVIGFKQFDNVNNNFSLKHKYKHPRQMVFGAVKTLTPSKCETYGIEFKAFELVNALDLGITSFEIGLRFISNIGIQTAHFSVVNSESLVEDISIRADIVKKLNYPTDGLVLVRDDISKHYIEAKSKKYPDHARSFKWSDELFETIVEGVDWSVSPKGLISPVILLKHVEIMGSTVKRVNMHNLSILKDKQVGIGDRVLVYKANMIIPSIDRSLDKTGGIEPPDICPRCNSNTEIYIGSNGISEFLKCTNANCGKEVI